MLVLSKMMKWEPKADKNKYSHNIKRIKENFWWFMIDSQRKEINTGIVIEMCFAQKTSLLKIASKTQLNTLWISDIYVDPDSLI